MSDDGAGASASDRQRQRWQGRMRWLALLSIGWNACEAVSGLVLGGLDSQVAKQAWGCCLS